MNLSASASFHDHKMNQDIDPLKGYAFFSSIGFHALLLILTFVGIPFVAQDKIMISEPVIVELVEIDKETRAPVKPTPKKLEGAEQKKPEPTKKQAAAPVKEAPQDAVPPPPSPDAKPVEKVAEKPDPVVPPPSIKPKFKPKARPKPVQKKPEPEDVQSDDAFSSLLKNLTPDLPEDFIQNETQQSETESAQIAPLGERLTMSELDAFKQQLAPCWYVQSGAKYAENLRVDVKVFLGRDQRIQSASLVDQVRYGLDSHFRAAADAALRALRNPACQPFDLPSDKYDQWREMTIRFNPNEML